MIKPNGKSSTQIVAGRVLGPPGSPAFALAGLRVSVADNPRQITFTDASGDFRLIGVDLPEGATLLVHRGENIIGAGSLVPHGVIEIAPPAAPNVPTSLDSAAPLTVADRKLLFSLLAEIEGIEKAVIHAITMGLAELALLETEAQDFLAGERAGVNVLALISEELPWTTKVPFFAERAAEADEVFALISPGAPVLAGALLAGELEHAGERAITAYLRRAEPLARLVRTARSVGAGAAKLETLAEMARWAAPLLAGPIPIKDLVAQFRKGPVLPKPFGPPDLPIPQRYRWLDIRNAEWLNCVMSVPTRVPPPQKTPKGPTGFFAVTPAAICKSAATGTVTLQLTATADSFGAQSDFLDWALRVGSVSANITSWTKSEITADVTGLASGCNLVRWVYTANALPVDVIGGACRQALRLPPWKHVVVPELPAPGSHAGISVLDPLIQGFTANGASAVVGGPTLTVEACTVILISWSVKPNTCVGDEALVSVSLLRDGSVLAANLPFAGTRLETANLNHTYTLRVESKNSNGIACGTLDRTLGITTFRRLTLILPPQITGGTSAKASVRASCPAPAGGLSVTLVASPAGKVGVPASVLILAGQREVEFDVAGNDCGGTSLTASAPAHNAATAATCVLRPPQFILPTLAPLRACMMESFTLTVMCVTTQVKATLISAAGKRTQATVKLVSGGSGPCVGDAGLQITTPLMEAGAYDLELSDRGGATLSTTRLSFVSTPVVVKVSPVGTVVAQSARPNTIAKLRVFARGADRVIGTVASTAVQVLIMRPVSSTPCDEWSAEAQFAVVCPTDSINLVAVSGPAGSPPVISSAPFTVPVRVDSSNVYSAISFRNQSGYLLRISISRLDPDGQGGKIHVVLGDTPLGSNSGNISPEFRFPLTPCAEYSYTVRQTVSGVESTVRDKPDGVIGGACGGVFDVLV